MRVQKEKNSVFSSNNNKKKFTKSKNIPYNMNPPLNFDKNCLPKRYKKINKEPQKDENYLDVQTKKHIEGISSIQKIYEPTSNNNFQKNKISKSKPQSRNNEEDSNYNANYKTVSAPDNEKILKEKTNPSNSTKNIFSPSKITTTKNSEEQSNRLKKPIITNETNKYRKNASSAKRRKIHRTDLFDDNNTNTNTNSNASDIYKKNELPYKCNSPNFYKFQSYVDERKLQGIDDNSNDIDYDNYCNRNDNRNERYSRSKNPNIELSQDNALDYYNEKQNMKNNFDNSRNRVEMPNNLYSNYCINKMIPDRKSKLCNNFSLNKNNVNYIHEGFRPYNKEVEIGKNNILNPISRSFFGKNKISNYQKNRNMYYTNKENEINNRRNGHFPNYSPKVKTAQHHSMIEENIQLSPMKNYIDNNVESYNNRSALKRNNKIRIIKNDDNQIKQFDISLSEEGEERVIPKTNNNYNDNYYYGKEVIPMINNQFNINSNKKIIINNNKRRTKNGGHSMQKRNNNDKSIDNKEKNPNKTVYYEKNSPYINNNENMANKVFVKKLIKNELPNQSNNSVRKRSSISNENIIDNENKNNIITASNETKDTNENVQKEIIVEKIIEKTIEKHTFTTMSPCKSNSFELLKIIKPNEKKNLNDSNDIKKSDSGDDNSEKFIFNNEDEVIDYVYTKFDEERKKKSYFNRKLKFTGFILTKKLKGKDVINIRIEDDLEKLNEQLKEESVTVENQLIEVKFLGDKDEKTNENNNEQIKTNDENNSNMNVNNLKEIENKYKEENSKLKKENEKWARKDVIKSQLINKLDKEKLNLLEEIKKLNKEIEIQKIVNNKLIFRKNDSQLFEDEKLKENKGEFLEIIGDKKNEAENKKIENEKKNKKDGEVIGKNENLKKNIEIDNNVEEIKIDDNF